MNYHVDNNLLIKEGLISDTIICCQEFYAPLYNEAGKDCRKVFDIPENT